jgi:hypothetical protein
MMLGALWTILTLPFRLIAWVVELVGRLTGVVLGFALMVIGVALCSGAFLPLGIPLFVVGLVLLLRSLG